MLDSIKKLSKSWVSQLLLVLLVISFAVWGVADIFTGFGSNTVATVGKIEISANEFGRRYDLTVTELSRQFGKQFTPEEARQLGLPSQVLSRLLAEATLDDTVHDMQLSLSPATVGRMITTDPSLVGPTGKFDRTYFGQIAQQNGLTDDQFVLERRAEYIRSQLAQALLGNIQAPAPMLAAMGEYRGDQRKISYVVLEAPPATEIAEPTEADLTSYFDAHKIDWKAPEYRAVSYFELSPSEIAKPDEVSDEDARKRYDAQLTRFTTPGTRHVEQIVFKDRAEADAAAEALKSGKTFDILITERNLKPSDTDLGTITKDKIIDPAIADAAFGMEADGVSGVIDGRFGPVIVRVSEIKPEVVKTFDEVKAQLRTEIAQERAAAEIADMHDSIEDARAGGDKLPEVAAKYGMTVKTIADIDAAGKNPAGEAVADVPAGLVTAAFDTDVGNENDPLSPNRSTYVWYNVTAVSPAHDRPFAEVRDKVVTAWKDAERVKQLQAEADKLKGQINSGDDIVKVALDAKLDLRTVDKVSRGMPPDGQLTADAIKAAFDGPKGYVALADGTTPMSRILLVVDDSTVPPFDPNVPEFAQTKQQLASQYVNDLLSGYVTERQSKIEVNINQAALAAVLGISQTTN